MLWMSGIRRDVLEVTTGFLQVPRAATLEYAFAWTALYWPRSLYSLAFLSRITLDMLLLLCVYCYWTRVASERARERWGMAVLYGLLMLLPLTASLAACYVVRPVLTLRYVLPASSVLYTRGRCGGFPAFRTLRWGAVFLLACLMVAHHVEAARPYRPNIKQMGETLAASQEPDGLVLESIVDAYARRMYVDFPEENVHQCPSKSELPGLVTSLLDRHAAVWVLCEFGYSRNYSSLEELEDVLRQGGQEVERRELSSGHYTFMTNSNWPDLSDIGQSIVLYRVSKPFSGGQVQSRTIRPAAISIFSS